MSTSAVNVQARSRVRHCRQILRKEDRFTFDSIDSVDSRSVELTQLIDSFSILIPVDSSFKLNTGVLRLMSTRKRTRASGGRSDGWSWRSLRPATLGVSATALAFDPTGSLLAVGYIDDQARTTHIEVWEMVTVFTVVRVLRVAEHSVVESNLGRGSDSDSTSVSPSSSSAASAVGGGASVTAKIESLAWSPCSRYLVAVHGDGRVVVWNVMQSVPLCDVRSAAWDSGVTSVSVLRAWAPMAASSRPSETDTRAASQRVRCRGFIVASAPIPTPVPVTVPLRSSSAALPSNPAPSGGGLGERAAVDRPASPLLKVPPRSRGSGGTTQTTWLLLAATASGEGVAPEVWHLEIERLQERGASAARALRAVSLPFETVEWCQPSEAAERTRSARAVSKKKSIPITKVVLANGAHDAGAMSSTRPPPAAIELFSFSTVGVLCGLTYALASGAITVTRRVSAMPVRAARKLKAKRDKAVANLKSAREAAAAAAAAAAKLAAASVAAGGGNDSLSEPTRKPQSLPRTVGGGGAAMAAAVAARALPPLSGAAAAAAETAAAATATSLVAAKRVEIEAANERSAEIEKVHEVQKVRKPCPQNSLSRRVLDLVVSTDGEAILLCTMGELQIVDPTTLLPYRSFRDAVTNCRWRWGNLVNTTAVRSTCNVGGAGGGVLQGELRAHVDTRSPLSVIGLADGVAFATGGSSAFYVWPCDKNTVTRIAPYAWEEGEVEETGSTVPVAVACDPSRALFAALTEAGSLLLMEPARTSGGGRGWQGAMYPVGFEYINDCDIYVEKEDEFDRAAIAETMPGEGGAASAPSSAPSSVPSSVPSSASASSASASADESAVEATAARVAEVERVVGAGKHERAAESSVSGAPEAAPPAKRARDEVEVDAEVDDADLKGEGDAGELIDVISTDAPLQWPGVALPRLPRCVRLHPRPQPDTSEAEQVEESDAALRHCQFWSALVGPMPLFETANEPPKLRALALANVEVAQRGQRLG